MSGRALFRASGVALILGGMSGSLAHILHLQYHPSQPAEVLPYVSRSEPVHSLLFVAILLVLLGLPALLVRQHEKIGILGLTGFVLLYFGLVFGEWLHCVLEIGIYPAMAHLAPNEMITVVNQMYEGRSPYAVLEFVGGWFLLVGVLIVGIAILIGRTFPRWNALLLLATDLGALLAFTPWTHWMVGGRWPVAFYLGLVAIGCSLFKSSAIAQVPVRTAASMSANAFVGAWRLLSFETSTSSGEVSYPLGRGAVGLLLYGQEGCVAVSVMRGDRSNFKAANIWAAASPEEKLAAFDSYSSYCGRYEVRHDKIIHYVELSLFPNWSGVGQERYFEFAADRLTLWTPPAMVGGVEQTAIAIWQRVNS